MADRAHIAGIGRRDVLKGAVAASALPLTSHGITTNPGDAGPKTPGSPGTKGTKMKLQISNFKFQIWHFLFVSFVSSWFMILCAARGDGFKPPEIRLPPGWTVELVAG